MQKIWKMQGKAESDEDGKDVADTKPQPDAEDMEDAIELVDESPKKRMRIEREEVMKDSSEEEHEDMKNKT